MRKFISVLLVLCVCLSMCSVTAFGYTQSYVPSEQDDLGEISITYNGSPLISLFNAHIPHHEDNDEDGFVIYKYNYLYDDSITVTNNVKDSSAVILLSKYSKNGNYTLSNYEYGSNSPLDKRLDVGIHHRTLPASISKYTGSKDYYHYVSSSGSVVKYDGDAHSLMLAIFTSDEDNISEDFYYHDSSNSIVKYDGDINALRETFSISDSFKVLKYGESVTFKLPKDTKDTMWGLRVLNSDTVSYCTPTYLFSYDDSVGKLDYFSDRHKEQLYELYKMHRSDLSHSGGLPFEDVKQSDYFYDPVIWACAYWVTNGTTDTTFSPNLDCTHEQILTFLYRVFSNTDVNSLVLKDVYPDVSKNEYYTDALIWARSIGMIKDCDIVGVPVKRSDVVKYLYYLSGEKDYSTAPASCFTDMEKYDDLTLEAVSWAVMNDITDGISDTEFGPELICTRGQIMTFLYRSLLPDVIEE